ARAYLEPYDSWANRIAILRFIQDIPMTPNDTSWQTLVEIEKKLSKIQKVPMLILWGGNDFCFTRHFYEEWQVRFPDAESHLFPQAGHYILEDAFEPIAPLITAFLEKHIIP
ncbi:MAG: alpha/beta hydrolase, partial [Desulfobulbales bacterium]|nr:alpha/beta hydrolase [Desulfobulbales bacterium]